MHQNNLLLLLLLLNITLSELIMNKLISSLALISSDWSYHVKFCLVTLTCMKAICAVRLSVTKILILAFSGDCHLIDLSDFADDNLH